MASIIFKHTCDIDFKDYDVAAGTTTFTGAIVTKDSTSLTDTNGVLLDGDNTLIEATFVGDFTLDPNYPFDFYGILELDVRGIGGDTWIKQISTVYDSVSLPNFTDQVWNGTVPINKASLTVTTAPDTVVIAAELDYTKLDFTINEYKLTARLGRIPTIPEFCLTTEGGVDIDIESVLDCVATEQ